MNEAVVITIVVTAATIALCFCIIAARSIAAMSNAINEQNEKHSQHMRILTNMFAESSLAISEKNLELLMRKHDVQTAPVTRYNPPAPPEDTFDINAIIEAGPPHGGDPSK
jgi:hypothetical protein